MHAAALWSTAFALTVLVGRANERWYFAGFSKSQEARKARFTRFDGLNDTLDITTGPDDALWFTNGGN